MKKIGFIISAIALILSACAAHREVADQTFEAGWMRYQCGLFYPNFDQHPSKAVASILKEVNGVYYCGEDVKIGKYEFVLEKVTDNFFKVKDKELYIELRGEIPFREEYHGILEVRPVKI